MPYCTVDEARERLPDIDSPDYDSEIKGCIEQAETVVDDMLRKHATVPLAGTIPNSVKHATADIAAAIFRSRRVPDGKLPALYKQGRDRVQGYIDSEYKGGTLTR